MATTAVRAPESLRGTTIRWQFTEGPTKGNTFEHVFYKNGSVGYREVVDGKGEGELTKEKECGVERISPTVHVISYLSESGYTLTAVLDFEDMKVMSFASNNKEWYPAWGTIELVQH